ncbi:unnamed protein product [Pedinophyceae sp. YPF-701]|nr:unnamed protein product [Pedinophyceae sp. YPF-701]
MAVPGFGLQRGCHARHAVSTPLSSARSRRSCICMRAGLSPRASAAARGTRRGDSGTARPDTETRGAPDERGFPTVRSVFIEKQEGADADAGAPRGRDGTDGGALVSRERKRPLAINIDLLLYNARLANRKAHTTLNPETRARLLAEAEETFRAAVRKDPEDPRPYVGLGKLLGRAGRWEEARRLYEDGSQATNGTSAHLWQAWATMESLRGREGEARKLFDAATVADASHAAAWHGWGMLEMRGGNLARARDLFLRGLKHARPGNESPFLYHSLSRVCRRMGDIEGADIWLERGVDSRRGRGSFVLWKDWALLAAETGDMDAARMRFRRALQINPRARYVYSDWARVEREAGSREAARQLLQTGLELNRTDTVLIQALARMEAEDGDLAAARRLFFKGTKLAPDHLYVWQAWAVAEYEGGDVATARALFRRALWCQPGSPDAAKVLHAWATHEATAGHETLARELFRCAILADPENERCWQTFAAWEERCGYDRRAMELRLAAAGAGPVPPMLPLLPADEALRGTGMSPKIYASVVKWTQEQGEWRAKWKATPRQVRRRARGPAGGDEEERAERDDMDKRGFV